MTKWPEYGDRPLICRYGHTEEDHERVGACRRPGLGTVHGIRTTQSFSITYPVTEFNQPAMELLFDLCLACRERRRNCTCHERGYN